MIYEPEIKSVLICGKMVRLSYLSPKTAMRESKIHGRGLFASSDIAKGEIVAVKGGHIISREVLRRKITPRLGPVEIQIGDDLFIAPVTDEEREGSMLYSNHSCDANLGLRGEITFVAMRDIHAGEEPPPDGARPMTTIIRLNAIAARRIAEKFSPAKIGSAENCKSIMLDISHR